MKTNQRSKYLWRLHNILGVKGMTLRSNELAILILKKKEMRQPKEMTKAIATRIIDEFMREMGITYSRKTKIVTQTGSFVYFVQQGGGERHIKIGKADNVEQRISELQTGSPYPLILLKTIPAENKAHALALEKTIHDRLKTHRLSGEWFTCSVMDNIGLF